MFVASVRASDPNPIKVLGLCILKTERRFFVRKIATKYFRDFQGSSIADVLREQSIHKPSVIYAI